MFENRSEEERKKIFWIFVIGITLVILIIWIILFAKGIILKSSELAETKAKNANEQNISSITNELKKAVNEFNKFDINGKISDIKDELNNVNSIENQNENKSLNLNENINQEQVQVQTNEKAKIEELINQDAQENINNSVIPRLPVE
ncbi:MAG: hypothetical protein PHN19_05075 [Patescibacteria group bacterium]|nr:hypothetical protein [Patescibacteria group bacterium]